MDTTLVFPLALLAWAGGLLLHGVFAALALWRRSGSRALALSALAALAPLTALAFFVHVFVVGDGSNVSQFSYDPQLWRLWYHVHLPLLAATGVSVLLLLGAVVMRPRPTEAGWSFASRLCGLVAAGSALPALLQLFPDT